MTAVTWTPHHVCSTWRELSCRCVCAKEGFSSFPGLFLKVPTGAVQFASCPTDGPSDLQFLTFSPLRAGNTLSAQSINILMPSSSSSLALPWRLSRCVYFFARISIRYALDVYVLCTGSVKVAMCWRGGSPTTSLSSLQDRFLFAVPAAKLEDMRSNNFFLLVWWRW